MHIPVLLEKTIMWLAPSPNKDFIDATLGEGGHAQEILKQTAPKGRLLGFDYDRQTLEKTSQALKIYGPRVKLVCDNFANIEQVAHDANFTKVDGILMDLGFSSVQLESGFGLSFQKDEPLDMRINPILNPISAADIINRWPKNKLEEIFKKYGNESKAEKIAGAICERRRQEKIRRSSQLAQIIGAIIPTKHGRHPATKVFQALRIVVNSELENLDMVLPQAVSLLKKGGRLAIISFHSGEDRIVKNFFRQADKLEILTKKPIQPTYAEIRNNPRSRSGKLRVAEKK